MDVAWSKILADDNDLTLEQMNKVRDELANGLHLDHPHVIKMYRCWSDDEHRCINSVTEFFTSGNLRDYSQKHEDPGYQGCQEMGSTNTAGFGVSAPAGPAHRPR